MTDCDVGTTEDDWIHRRFTEHCYFYPMRDCPGWKPGDVCARIGETVPLTPDDEQQQLRGGD